MRTCMLVLVCDVYYIDRGGGRKAPYEVKLKETATTPATRAIIIIHIY